MRLGIDLGGTKIEAVVLDNTGHVCFRQRIATPQGDYQGTLNAMCALVNNAKAHTQNHLSIGIGIPGALSPSTGKVKNANSVCLIGQPLKEDLEALLGQPVRIANDADCFALSEAVDGAGKDAQSVFGVILGTGVGGGICIRQQLVSGPNRISGEWGHNPLPWMAEHDLPAPACYCGKHGCIETYLSGPGFSATFTDTTLAPADIWAHAAAGNVAAQQHCERYIDRLARSLASVINILDPEVIVLGGGLSNIEALYAQLPNALEPYVFSDTVNTPIKAAMYGDASGVRGAAWLWNDSDV